MEPQIRYARTSDGVNIAWYAIGSGTPYVWPTSPSTPIGAEWRIPELRQLLEDMARRATFVSYNARGSGLSDRGLMDFSCEAMVRDLEAVVEAGELPPFILQTWKHHSIPALVYAARHPDMVLALVMLNGVLRGADLSDSWRRMIALVSEDWEDGKRAISQSNEPGYSFTATLRQLLRLIDESTSQEEFTALGRAIDGWDASEVVGQVATPALVLNYGELAHHVPQEATRRLAASLPNAVFSSLPPTEAGEVFATVNGIVRGFLRDALPPEARRRPSQSLHSGMTAILFADIVDSTGLTENLGDATFREKARDLDAGLRRIIREAGGTPIEGKLLGDGVLATFASARQAIKAALSCGAAGDDRGLPLHLGLQAGDVISEEGNVYGGAVTIAARISDQTAPGEVLVSQTVRDLARTSAGVAFEDGGERELKGVGEPVRVWRVQREAG
ncbi:MAG TPA: adenylate/guanylate cyclase domain-containing protein [Dehalococcoidia bacterium]|nr:adenylate/guanylate cyclase domain-containing protein [Dehalococcoidia bacterium]